MVETFSATLASSSASTRLSLCSAGSPARSGGRCPRPLRPPAGRARPRPRTALRCRRVRPVHRRIVRRRVILVSPPRLGHVRARTRFITASGSACAGICASTRSASAGGSASARSPARPRPPSGPAPRCPRPRMRVRVRVRTSRSRARRRGPARGPGRSRLGPDQHRPAVVLGHVEHRAVGLGVGELAGRYRALVQEQPVDPGIAERAQEIRAVHGGGLRLPGLGRRRAGMGLRGRGCQPAARCGHDQDERDRPLGGGQGADRVGRVGAGLLVAEQRPSA